MHAQRRPEVFFAKETSFVKHVETKASRRRLLRARGDDKKHPFYVADVVEGFEELVALVVVCAAPAATVQQLSDVCLNHAGCLVRVSDARVPLFECAGGVELAGALHTHFYLRKLHLLDGQQLFMLVGEEAGGCNNAWALGLDRDAYGKLQKAAAYLLCATLVHS